MKKGLTGFVLILIAALVGFGLWPSPLDSVAWKPPEPPALEGGFAPNEVLGEAELVARGSVTGPEDTEVDAQGRVHAGLDDGRVIRIDGGDVTTLADTGGRPLGMEFDAEGNLIVADAERGLLSISPAGNLEVLATESNGVPFRFTDDLAVADDGTIYFSDASHRFGHHQYRLDMLSGRGRGRLMAYDPETDETRTLMDNLYFANGVALGEDDVFVLVNETARYRIQRYWLKGDRAGQSEIFVDNLPGFPDNLSRDDEGIIWLALPTRRNAQIDSLHPYPWLKNMAAKLPRSMQPGPEPYGFVAAFNEEGELLGSLHDTDGDRLRMITSVKARQGALYFGSLDSDRIGRLDRDRAVEALGRTMAARIPQSMADLRKPASHDQ